MPSLAELKRLHRTLQRDRRRLELLLQLLVTERELLLGDVTHFDPVIRRVRDRLEQATERLRACEKELSTL